VTVVVTGHGMINRIDIDIIVGSSLTLQRDVGLSRTSYPVGPSRLDRGA
jgi:hypothetical protein